MFPTIIFREPCRIVLAADLIPPGGLEGIKWKKRPFFMGVEFCELDEPLLWTCWWGAVYKWQFDHSNDPKIFDTESWYHQTVVAKLRQAVKIGWKSTWYQVRIHSMIVVTDVRVNLAEQEIQRLSKDFSSGTSDYERLGVNVKSGFISGSRWNLPQSDRLWTQMGAMWWGCPAMEYSWSVVRTTQFSPAFSPENTLWG